MIPRFVLLLCAALTFAGCASGPKYSEVADTLPPIAPGHGRVFVYRATSFGAAVQPAVIVNGQEICKAKPSGFDYTDVPAGDVEVLTSTEVKRKLTFQIAEAQARYVRLNMAMGFFIGHVWPELVETDTGLKEIAKCKYMAQPPAATMATDDDEDETSETQ